MDQTGIALVTGAGRRIGRAMALDLAKGGWAVAVHYHQSAQQATAVVEEIRHAGGTAEALAADLADEAAAGALVSACVEALGPPTLLVNSASAFENDSLATATRGSWDDHLDVNLRAPLVLIQGFAETLPHGAEGNVVNMLDQLVWNPDAGFLSYTISKVGLWTLTRTLALELAPRVRVNGIGPGPALPSKRQSDAQFAASCARMPLGRGTTPEEICRALRFILASPAMTGQMIALDGGQHLVSTAPPKDGAGPAEPPGRHATPGADHVTRQPTPRYPATFDDSDRSTRRMFIRDLMLDCWIGIHHFERDANQQVCINIDLTMDDSLAVDDNIANVLDYDDVIAGVKAIIAAGHINLVETLAERIGGFCIADPRVLRARVRVDKPGAISEAAGAGIEIERRAANS